MLAGDLRPLLDAAGHEVIGVDLPEVDITRPDQVEAQVDAARADLVINCAAYTDVDGAESEPELAAAVNTIGPRVLAEACLRRGVPLVHLSTDYVFGGTGRRAYREDDPPDPLGTYGRTKWEGEEAVRSLLPRHVIVRTAWLYGAGGDNFVKTMLRLGRERKEIGVVADQHGCPTWTCDLADALVAIVARIEQDEEGMPWGTYHYCGKGHTSWHGFAEAIFEQARRFEALRVRQVLPLTTMQYPTAARRPARSVMDCSKIGAAFGIRPRPWREALALMLRQLLSLGGAACQSPENEG